MNNPYHDPQYAQQYDRRWHQYNHYAYKLAEHILTFLPQAPCQILEIGCGTGNALYTLQQHYPHAVIHGIDQADAMVDIAKAKLPEATIETGTIDTAELLQSYDLIISISMFHYVDQPEAWLEKVSEHLTASGYLLLIDWNRNTVLMKMRSRYLTLLPHIKRVYSEQDIEKLLSKWNKVTMQRCTWHMGWWSLQGWLVTKATS